jgi:hypothetical protein
MIGPPARSGQGMDAADRRVSRSLLVGNSTANVKLQHALRAPRTNRETHHWTPPYPSVAAHPRISEHTVVVP